eukprot:TRINITY_DN12643_c0_g1_i2.p1 TRINITY_DN12643_c0_g1~~TRINITY_DN12643_c0_g1_i2.p1  ORF type:complete len:473 (-),score=87.54 TRINITY_DN12643_c0_g1_i2:326-1744(-)
MSTGAVVRRVAAQRCTNTARRLASVSSAPVPPRAIRLAAISQKLGLASSVPSAPLTPAWSTVRLRATSSSSRVSQTVRAASGGASRPRATRSREIEAACAALSESVEAGDDAWFERVVTQLRAVLAEQRHGEAAMVEYAASTDVSDARVWRDTEPFDDRHQDFTTTARTAATTVDSWRAPRALHDGFDESPTLPATSDDEPAWLQALRLLEVAALESPGGVVRPFDGGQGNGGGGEAAGSHGGCEDVEFQARQFEEGLPSYLGSFATGTARGSRPQPSASQANVPPPRFGGEDKATGMEPSWAKALRLLNAAGLDNNEDSATVGEKLSSSASLRRNGEFLAGDDGDAEAIRASDGDDHAGEDVRMQRYTQLLSGGGSGRQPEDPKQAIRMSRYAELLQEVDRIGQVAPGASVPSLRFSELVGRPRAAESSRGTRLPPPPPPPVMEQPSSPIASSFPVSRGLIAGPPCVSNSL